MTSMLEYIEAYSLSREAGDNENAQAILKEITAQESPELISSLRQARRDRVGENFTYTGKGNDPMGKPSQRAGRQNPETNKKVDYLTEIINGMSHAGRLGATAQAGISVLKGVPIAGGAVKDILPQGVADTNARYETALPNHAKRNHLIGNLGATAASMALPLSAPVAITNAIRGMSLGQKALTGVSAGGLGGAALGYTDGFLAGDNFADRKDKAERGAMGGFLFGAGAGLALPVGTSAAGGLRQLFANRGMQSKIDKIANLRLPEAKVLAQTAGGKIDPAKSPDILNRIRVEGDGANIGDATAGLKGLYNTSINAQGAGALALRNKDINNSLVLNADIGRRLGKDGFGEGKGFQAYKDELSERVKNEKAELYNKAFATPIDWNKSKNAELLSVIENNVGKDIRDKARNLAKRELEKTGKKRVQESGYTVQEINFMVELLGKGSTTGHKSATHSTGKLGARLEKLLGENRAAYRGAVAQSRLLNEQHTAIDATKSIFANDTNVKDAQAVIDGFTPEQLKVAQRAMMGSSKVADLAFLKSDDVVDKMAIMFNNEKTADAFRELVKKARSWQRKSDVASNLGSAANLADKNLLEEQVRNLAEVIANQSGPFASTFGALGNFFNYHGKKYHQRAAEGMTNIAGFLSGENVGGGLAKLNKISDIVGAGSDKGKALSGASFLHGLPPAVLQGANIGSDN